MNEMYKAREAGAAGTAGVGEAQEIYLKMMAPVTPHIAEELWASFGQALFDPPAAMAASG